MVPDACFMTGAGVGVTVAGVKAVCVEECWWHGSMRWPRLFAAVCHAACMEEVLICSPLVVYGQVLRDCKP